MKFVSIFLCILLGFIKFSEAQGYSNLFMSGYDCCSPGSGGTNIDWISGTPIISYVPRNMNFSGASANITNERGELLFYTNGDYIANSLNDTMANGSGLCPGPFANSYRRMGFPIPQSVLILPKDQGNSSLYYLIHEAGDVNVPLYSPTQLNYSIIDMSLNNGLGAVVSKNNVLLNDTLSSGLITACRHANGRDWWIVVPKTASNLYHIFLLTPFGIAHFSQQIGMVMDQLDWGQVVFSPEGEHYARMDSHNGLQILNFDRCSGTFSNFQHIDSAAFAGSPMFTGVAFSPNGRFLYVSHTLYVYQFDLLASNLSNSKMLVATYDGFVSGYSTTFYLAQLFNDGKIYIITGAGSDRLHVINYPDSLGLSCDVQQHSIVLSTYNAQTITTPPYFFSGAVDGSICDSLILISSNNQLSQNQLEVAPNPTHGVITLHCKDCDITEIKIWNSLGGNCCKTIENNVTNQIEFTIDEFQPGVYILEVILKSNKRVFKKIVLQ